MSLRDLGVFRPLDENHPLHGESCWICGKAFRSTRTALLPKETSDETGSLTVEAQAVCATCFLKGKPIKTPVGRRIVDYIKEGDVSHPVITTDRNAWRDEEVLPDRPV